MGAAEIFKLVTDGLRVLFDFAVSVGQRDAAISAMDAFMATARAQNDRDLDAKHGR